MIWDATPQIFEWGSLQVRWYGLMFAMAFFCGVKFLMSVYKNEGRDPEDANVVLIYMMIGTTIGARLGHCLFYEPEIYLKDPIRILKIWEGGLASHGGTLGVMLALWFYIKKRPGMTWLWLTDRLSIPIALGSGFIRVGNFFNSEIIGKPTDLPWAITFAQVSDLPRHPSQLYEALSYFSIFAILYILYRRYRPNVPSGRLIGLMFSLIFGARILIEFTKENQVAFESHIPLNMGQWLSFPMVAFGIIIFYNSFRLKSKK